MKKYLVLYCSPADAMAQMADTTPEDQAKGMEAWMQWAQKAGGSLTDLGQPLANGVQIRPDGTTAGSEKEIAGYSILQAENMEEAKKLLEGHPHTSGWHPNAVIELYEAMEIPGM